MKQGFLVVLLTGSGLVIETTQNIFNFIMDYPSEKKGLLYCQGISDIETVKALIKPIDNEYQVLLNINVEQNSVDVFNKNMQECLKVIQSLANKFPVVIKIVDS